MHFLAISSKFEIEPWAKLYEAGAEVFVGAVWANLLKQASENKNISVLVPAIHEAFKTDALRQLLPFTSMLSLRFSRCTGYPFSGDCPFIAPTADGMFKVISVSGAELGAGDAEKAVALVTANLPDDCGPAVHGTADTLNPHRAKRSEEDE